MFDMQTKMYIENKIPYSMEEKHEGFLPFTYEWKYLKSHKGKIQSGTTTVYCKNRNDFENLLKLWRKNTDWEFIGY